MHLTTMYFKFNSPDWVVPEHADRFGSLLCLQQGVLQDDRGVQDGRKRLTFAVDRGAHDGCVDHRTVGDSGNTHCTLTFA